MRLPRCLSWTLAVMLSAGCVTTPSAKPAPSTVDHLAARGDVVCEYVAETGSNIRRKVCIPREQAEAEAQAGEDGLRHLQRNMQTQQGPPPK